MAELRCRSCRDFVPVDERGWLRPHLCREPETIFTPAPKPRPRGAEEYHEWLKLLPSHRCGPDCDRFDE